MLKQELERIRSYLYTIHRSLNVTNMLSQALKHDLEIFRDHQHMKDEIFEVLDQCLWKSNEIQ